MKNHENSVYDDADKFRVDGNRLFSKGTGTGVKDFRIPVEAKNVANNKTFIEVIS